MRPLQELEFVRSEGALLLQLCFEAKLRDWQSVKADKGFKMKYWHWPGIVRSDLSWLWVIFKIVAVKAC